MKIANPALFFRAGYNQTQGLQPIVQPNGLASASGVVARRQRGVTLVMSLLFLLILSIFGVTAMRTSGLQEKMAGNTRDLDLALQAAETAMNAAHLDLSKRITTSGSLPFADTTASNGVYMPKKITGALVEDDSWWSAFSTNFAGPGRQLPAPYMSDPDYLIEEIGFSPDDGMWETQAEGKGYFVYRITARGRGAVGTTKTYLQDTYQARPPGK